MKNSFFLTALLLAGLCSSAQWQPPARSAIGISIGKQQLKFLDRHASPLMYNAEAAPLAGLFYHHQTSRAVFKVKLSGGAGKADPQQFGPRNYRTNWNDTSGFEYQISSQYYLAGLQATYLRKIHPSSHSSISHWVGGIINESAYYADEVANFPWMMNALDISPAYQLQYDLSSAHHLGVSVNITGIGIVTRTVYGLFPKSNKDKNVKAFMKQGTRLATPGTWQKAHLAFTYKLYLLNRMALSADYQLKWFRHTHPRTIRAIDTNYSLSFEYLLHRK